MPENDINKTESFSQVSELFHKYEGTLPIETPSTGNSNKPVTKEKITTEVAPIKQASVEDANKGCRISESTTQKALPYKLEQIVVTEQPINNTLTLKSYMLRSLTGILHQGSDLRKPFYYIMDIKNNTISGGPYTEAICVFDSDSTSVYRCVQAGVAYYVTIDQHGVAHHELVRIPYTVTNTTFYFNAQSYSLPTKPLGKSAIDRKGSLIVLNTDNKKFLINFEHGTLVGFSFEESKTNDGYIMIGSEEKYPLARLSPEILLVRDNREAKEEYVVRNSRLVISRDDMLTAGGWFFLSPNEDRSTFLTFVPQELGFGGVKTFRAKNVKTYANGVYFGKERILFIDMGKYFLNVANENLEEKIVIDDSLIFLKGGE